MPAAFLGPFEEITPGDAAAGPQGQPDVLPFTVQRQLQSHWCWAAVTASVCGFYGDGPENSTQCKVAGTFLGVECCLDPMPPFDAQWPGNKKLTLDFPLGHYQHLVQPLIEGKLTFDDIVSEIKKRRVICCHVRWAARPDDGHFLAIVGYHLAARDIIVQDPDPTTPHSGTYRYDEFEARIGGKWDETYLTAPSRGSPQ